MSENKLGDLDSRPIKFKPTQSKDSCASGICTKLLCPLILSHHGGTLGIPVIRKKLLRFTQKTRAPSKPARTRETNY